MVRPGGSGGGWPRAADAALAVSFFAVSLLELAYPLEEVHARGPVALDIVVQALFCSGLLLRSRAPMAGVAAMSATFLLPALVTAHAGFFFANEVPLLVMTFTAARRDRTAWSRWAWLSGLSFWLGLVLHARSHTGQVINPMLPVGLVVAAWAVGRVLGRLDVQRDQLLDARDRLALEQRLRQDVAVGQERARIAADMHDVVAHAVSLMVVQVGAARMSLEKHGPEQAELRAAERTGRQALDELRRSLGVLRAGQTATPPPAHPDLWDAGADGVPSLRPAPAQRTLSRRSVLADLVVAVAFAGAAALESVATGFDDGTRAGPVWLNVTLGVATCLPLAWRRRAPSAVYLTMLAVVLLPSVVVAHSLYLVGTLLPLCLAAYTAARSSDSVVARLAWLAALMPPAVVHERAVGAATSDIAFLLLFLGAATAAGRTMRRFDVQGSDLRATLESLAEQESAREQDAIDTERRRIAAEMHDVVAHAVSTMVVQIGATRITGGATVDQAELRAAERTGRQALAELRATLGLLGAERPALAPLPGQEALPALLEGFRAAGLDVRADVDLRGCLAAGLGLTVYRVVQEALTNALKHGAEGPVELRIRTGADLHICISNDIAAGCPRLPSGGHGLAGMRERVAVYGGSLAAQAEKGRFRVQAVLPLALLEVKA
jgi:signal transduction histidine kinase